MSKPSMRVAAAALVVAASSTIASANTFQKYGDVEGWNVFIDEEKQTCLIEAVDESENVVQMGLTKDRSLGYLGVFTKAETGIEQGKKKEVAILIGENIYSGEAMGMRGNITEGYSGGYIVSSSPDFVKDIEQQYEMVVFPEESFAFVVDLSGTKKAIEMARECNNSLLN